MFSISISALTNSVLLDFSSANSHRPILHFKHRASRSQALLPGSGDEPIQVSETVAVSLIILTFSVGNISFRFALTKSYTAGKTTSTQDPL